MPRLPLLLCGVLLSALPACAGSTRVSLPAELSRIADRYTIAGNVALHTPKINFGPYQARARAYRGGGENSGATIFNGHKDTNEDRAQGSFELTTASGQVTGKCVRESRTVTRHDRGDFELSSQNGSFRIGARDVPVVVEAKYSVRCSLRPSWAPELRLGLNRDGRLEARSSERVLALVELDAASREAPVAWQLESASLITQGEVAQAAVAISDLHPSVTFLRAVPQREKDQLAAVVMALVLLRDM